MPPNKFPSTQKLVHRTKPTIF